MKACKSVHKLSLKTMVMGNSKISSSDTSDRLSFYVKLR